VDLWFSFFTCQEYYQGGSYDQNGKAKWMEIFERDESQFSLNIILAKAKKHGITVSLPVPSKYVHI
jgi:hypothetical protein